jgi:uncharacterized protein DUF4129
VLALAAGLTTLLALVAVASRGDASPLHSGGGPSDALWDYLLSTYLVLGAVTFVAVVFLLARERESLPTKRTKHREIRHLIQFALVMLLLFFAARYILDAFRRDDDQQARGRPAQTGQSNKRRPERKAEPDAPEFRWAPVIALGTLGAIGIAILAVNRARRRSVLDEDEVADALASVLDDALADLRAERDLRRAIIAAYARMERLLAVHRVPRRASETPFEYLGRVLLELRASAPSVFELTALFERAKFSRHEIDGGMRDEAITVLATVRDELRETGPE